MGMLSWIVFGALAGWVASIIAGTNSRQGCITDIIVGTVGAVVGGFVMSMATGQEVAVGWNLPSFIVAVLGAVLVLFAFKFIRGRR